MNCPNCGNHKLHTIETFQTPDETIRTKKCKQCEWTFTSKESISDDLVIPIDIRLTRRKDGANYDRKAKRNV